MKYKNKLSITDYRAKHICTNFEGEKTFYVVQVQTVLVQMSGPLDPWPGRILVEVRVSYR